MIWKKDEVGRSRLRDRVTRTLKRSRWKIEITEWHRFPKSFVRRIGLHRLEMRWIELGLELMQLNSGCCGGSSSLLSWFDVRRSSSRSEMEQYQPRRIGFTRSRLERRSRGSDHRRREGRNRITVVDALDPAFEIKTRWKTALEAEWE